MGVIPARAVERDENEIRKQFTVTERLAIAQRIAERLQGRHGSNQYQQKGGGNISTSSDDAGKTRDIAAAKAGLGSGKTMEAAQKVVERGIPELVEAMDRGKVTIHAAKSVLSVLSVVGGAWAKSVTARSTRHTQNAMGYHGASPVIARQK